MAYKIEAHIIDEGTEEVFTTVTCWGEDEAEAGHCRSCLVKTAIP